MKVEDANYVKSSIDNEGFDYTFIHYRSFEDIEDEKFHELRKKYIDAHNELENYIDEFSDYDEEE